MITAELLRDLLEYDPETGVFRWRRNMRGPVRAGDIAGRLKPNGYLTLKVAQRDYLVHRLAFLYMTGEWPPDEVDHIDLARDNNRWANLRPATTTQNRGNQRMQLRNRAGLKGVSLHKKTGLYRARISTRTIGYYATPEEAHAVYARAAKERFGEFARS